MEVTILAGMSRQHIIRWDLMGVVFVGGCIGTGLRYACSFIADYGAFHCGTFTANMIACFAYATLSAWLGGSARLTGQGIREPWFRHGPVRRALHHVDARLGTVYVAAWGRYSWRRHLLRRDVPCRIRVRLCGLPYRFAYREYEEGGMK